MAKKEKDKDLFRALYVAIIHGHAYSYADKTIRAQEISGGRTVLKLDAEVGDLQMKMDYQKPGGEVFLSMIIDVKMDKENNVVFRSKQAKTGNFKKFLEVEKLTPKKLDKIQEDILSFFLKNIKKANA